MQPVDATSQQPDATSQSWQVQLDAHDIDGDDSPTAFEVVPSSCLVPLPGYPLVGVSVACLRSFVEAHHDQLEDLTTEEVCERIVKPLTKQARESLGRCVEASRAVDVATGAPLAGWPTVFISHARMYRFVDLVEAIATHCEGLDATSQAAPTYCWVDIFSQCQHMDLHRLVRWPSVFLHTIRLIGNTCLVIGNWKAPIPFQRAWLLWEVLCTFRAQYLGKCPLHIHLLPEDQVLFRGALKDGDYSAIIGALGSLDSAKATCYTPPDAKMIHGLIDHFEGSHAQLDSKVTTVLREWMLQMSRGHMDWLALETKVERGIGGYINNFGLLLHELGYFEESERLFREALQARRAKWGEEHPDTLCVVNNLGLVLFAQAKYDEVEPLFAQALASKRTLLGDTHPDTLTAIANLGGLYQQLGRLDDAEPLLLEELNASIAANGVDHPDAIESVEGVGRFRIAQGRLADAEPLLVKVFVTRRSALGERHPMSLDVEALIATLALRQGRLDKAEELATHVATCRAAIFGEDHPTFIDDRSLVSGIFCEQGRPAEALQWMQQAHAASIAVFGEAHSRTRGLAKDLDELTAKAVQADEAASFNITCKLALADPVAGVASVELRRI